MKRFLALLTVFTLSAARAGDLASLEFWGFSPDAHALAFEQYGFHDGSGFPFSRLAVVDVQKNTFIGYAETTLDTDGQDVTFGVVREPTRLKLEGTLKRSRVQRGLTGTLVFQKGSVVLLGMDFHRLPGASDLPKGATFRAGNKLYSLEVIPHPAPASTQCAFQNSSAQLLELRLKLGNQTRILQKEIRLPNSRACAYEYGIARVYVYRSSVAIFLRTLTPGFEGPNVGWMVVSGRL